MRNVYIYITTMLLFFSSNAQDLQNARWYFPTNAGLSFVPPNTVNPVPLAGGTVASVSAPASVSGQSGNLLFYVDNNKVRNAAHGIMPNGTGLKLTENFHNAIIVPKPGNTNIYFLITLSLEGLHYSEIDMSLAGGFGDIVSGSKNTVLKDFNGTNVDSLYNNVSEKLTSTKHADGVNYWVITQLRSRVHVYLASATGINLVSVTVSPVNIVDIPGNPQSALTGIGQMKISPNYQRIGISYTNDSTTFSEGVVLLGSFDNTTGTIIFDPLISVPGANLFTGLEFSPDSQIVYFSNYSTIFSTTGVSATINNVVTTLPPFLSGLQLGINGKIYASRASSNSLAVINNPNNISSPSFQNSINIAGTSGNYLPQWVHWHSQERCTPLVLTSEPNTTFIYDDYSTITAETAYVLSAGKDITMKAADFIVLKSGTHIGVRAKYWGKIDPCRNIIELRPGAGQNDFESFENLSSKDVKLFTLSPNPASEMVKISATENIQSIVVTSFEGKTVFTKDFRDGEDDYELYIGNYVKGFYSVTVTTQQGQLHTEKLIKD